jgi:hypothetical protein
VRLPACPSGVRPYEHAACSNIEQHSAFDPVDTAGIREATEEHIALAMNLSLFEKASTCSGL